MKNSKRYRVLKLFPNPLKKYEVGEIISEAGHKGLCDIAEEWPDYFEEVEEKDYEIVQMRNKSGNIYSVTPEEGLAYELTHHTIYSVKRKDGEIFSVGDKIDFKEEILGETIPHVKTITGISLDATGYNRSSKRSIPWLDCGEGFGVGLEYAVHYKEPILITEDGKEIYDKEEEVWGIYADDFGHIFHSTAERALERWKYGCFSSKEAAEKYVEEDIPMYSKKDITNLFDKLTTHAFISWDDLWKELEELKKGE